MAFEFKKASTKRARLRAAITGAAGAGKTYGALLIARGLVGPEGRIALIDTEHRRSEAYARRVEFDIAELDPPYSPERYIEAFEAAWALGYDALVVDSLSHAWAGTGGVRQIVDREKERSTGGAKDWKAWGKGSEEQQRLVDKIVSSRSHIICTIRTKMATALVEGKVVKVGLEPIQREGIEYEYDLCLDVERDSHNADVSKCNTDWARQIREALAVERKITVELGQKIRGWIEASPPEDALAKKRSWLVARAAELPTPESVEAFRRLVRSAKDLQELELREAQLESKLKKQAAPAHAPSSSPEAKDLPSGTNAGAAPTPDVSAGHGVAPPSAPERKPATAETPSAPNEGRGVTPGEAGARRPAGPATPPPAAAVPLETARPGDLAKAMGVPADHPLAPDPEPKKEAAPAKAAGFRDPLLRPGQEEGAQGVREGAPRGSSVPSFEGKPWSFEELTAYLGANGISQRVHVEKALAALQNPGTADAFACAAYANLMRLGVGEDAVFRAVAETIGESALGIEHEGKRKGKKYVREVPPKIFPDLMHRIRMIQFAPEHPVGRILAAIAESRELVETLGPAPEGF